MLPGMELMHCPALAVPLDVMQHVVRVESSFNPYAIGVVGGRLRRQPKTLSEALATVRMLERRGFNFSLGLAQVNRHNLGAYGLDSYEKAFEACPNLQAGSRILAECLQRSGRDWGKAFSCYYSGNFVTGFRHGYVQKVFASMGRQPLQSPARPNDGADAIDVVERPSRRAVMVTRIPAPAAPLSWQRRVADGEPAPHAIAAAPDSATHAHSTGNAPAPATPVPEASDAVAVLDGSGKPPALVSPRLPARHQDAASTDARDAAFVF